MPHQSVQAPGKQRLFFLSVERHALRNFVFLHAIENGLPLPIGTTDAGLLDTQSFDKDADGSLGDFFDTEDGQEEDEQSQATALRSEAEFRQRAAEIYQLYAGPYKRRFRWLAAHHFKAELGKDLAADAATLRQLLVQFGEWSAARDAKLEALENLLMSMHPERKVLVFTQFADTVPSNLRDLNPTDWRHFPVPESAMDDPEIHRLGTEYVADLRRNSTMLVRNQKSTGGTETQSFKVQKSKPIIDEIDRILAKHYGFTDEELDFIINYDIKYRVG